nr:NifB/NifX family molybdenum-iron cluster-binding protein [Oscillospiraceae bacterium]
MKVAVSYKDGEIYEHFGHAEFFAIYDFDVRDMSSTKKLIDVRELHGHQAMADRMKAEGVDAVLCGMMGGEAKALLLSYGIVPVVGYCGDADTAAELLILGRLPLAPGDGACSGGCGGCGGSCGGCGDEGG